MSTIQQLLLDTFGVTSDTLGWWLLLTLAFIIYVYLSERIKAFLERITASHSTKKEMQSLREDIVKSFRREEEAKERLERSLGLAEKSIVERNAALWTIVQLKQENAALRRQLSELMGDQD